MALKHLTSSRKMMSNDHEQMVNLVIEFANELELTNPESWYNVRTVQLKIMGGAMMLDYYNYSLYKLLADLFPEHEWHAWRFNRVPHGYWEDPSNQRTYLDWLGKQLGIKDLNDWYKIQMKDVQKIGPNTLFEK
jgi:hypothetical protein